MGIEVGIGVGSIKRGDGVDITVWDVSGASPSVPHPGRRRLQASTKLAVQSRYPPDIFIRTDS